MTGRPDVLRRFPDLARLARDQAQACTRAQLSAIGVDESHVRRHVDHLRWRPLGPHVVVLHNGPIVGATRAWVVVLNSGPGAALGAWTALEEWGLRNWQRDALHIVVRRGVHPPELPEEHVGVVVVHESRRHGPGDIVRLRGLPLHSRERSAVDCGAWSRTDRTACGLLAAVVQQRLTTADRLTIELDTVGRVRRVRLMRATLADIGGGSQALSEIDFVRFCRRYGLPEPVRQAVRRDSRGRRRYIDVEWRLPDGRRLALEIDGIGHMDVERWYEDLLRAAEVLAADGTALVPLPALACRVEPERVAALLRTLLGVVSR